MTDGYDRVSMHGVRRALLHAQAAARGAAAVETVRIPAACANGEYEAVFARALGAEAAGRRGAAVAFGDLFLEDVRAYRERLVAAARLAGGFPLWGEDTAALARRFVADGFRAQLVCVDPRQVDAGFCGRAYDARLLDELPAGADPCGENGEFHTFVHDPGRSGWRGAGRAGRGGRARRLRVLRPATRRLTALGRGGPWQGTASHRRRARRPGA